MSPSLAIVADNTSAAGQVETLAQHIRRLQAEAKALAFQQIKMLEAALDEVTRLSAEVACGGEAYPVGAREVARQLAEETKAKRQTLDVLTERSRS